MRNIFIAMFTLMANMSLLLAKCDDVTAPPIPEKIQTAGIGKLVIDANMSAHFIFDSYINRKDGRDFVLKKAYEIHKYPNGHQERDTTYDNPIFFLTGEKLQEGYYYIFSDVATFEEAANMYEKRIRTRYVGGYEGLGCIRYHLWATSIKKGTKTSRLDSSLSYIKTHNFLI